MTPAAANKAMRAFWIGAAPRYRYLLALCMLQGELRRTLSDPYLIRGETVGSTLNFGKDLQLDISGLTTAFKTFYSGSGYGRDFALVCNFLSGDWELNLMEMTTGPTAKRWAARVMMRDGQWVEECSVTVTELTPEERQASWQAKGGSGPKLGKPQQLQRSQLPAPAKPPLLARVDPVGFMPTPVPSKQQAVGGIASKSHKSGTTSSPSASAKAARELAGAKAELAQMKHKLEIAERAARDTRNSQQPAPRPDMLSQNMGRAEQRGNGSGWGGPAGNWGGTYRGGQNYGTPPPPPFSSYNSPGPGNQGQHHGWGNRGSWGNGQSQHGRGSNTRG